MEVSSLLSGQTFFAELTARDLSVLADAATVRDLSPNEALVRTGDRARTFYLVCEGEIRREVPSLVGPPLVMHSIGPGEVLGWAWLIPPRRWAFVARADRPTRVVEFDGERIFEQCESDPRFGYELLKRFSRLMSDRLTQARQQMLNDWNPSGFG
jgi:CRP/FNR family cyclic AMP-dependent transcriptional regulator